MTIVLVKLVQLMLRLMLIRQDGGDSGSVASIR